MRIYNKKGLIWAVAWILLSGWNLVHSLADPASSGLVQGKDLLLSLFMLAVGIMLELYVNPVLVKAFLSVM